jgi:hypothetical protein
MNSNIERLWFLDMMHQLEPLRGWDRLAAEWLRKIEEQQK